MGLNITEKILLEHVEGGAAALKAGQVPWTAGEEIALRIDQTLTQDATGTMAYLQFESMGLDRIRAELAVSYVDHNTVQVGSENADDHAYLASVAARCGAIFSRPGNGICHQLHLERFGAPGKTLIGSDSHTPTGGGLGMIAIGAGGIDVAVAMGGGPFHLNAPRVLRLVLTGRLRPWVSAKDVILQVLETFSTNGNVGCVFEYAGPGVATLSVPERATIANMGAECGVTTSVFPSDLVTRQFLQAQGRAAAWRELKADPDAAYAREVTLDLGAIEPLAAQPHSPGRIATVASLAGLPVQQVLIGSCTNSSYRDLKTVALILKGHTVHPSVSLGLAPGSRQVLCMLAREGLLADLLAAGARLLENACGFCIGNSMSPGTDAVSLRTSNRNFEGRSGTPSAKVYLVSPETAALAALRGCLVDPFKAGVMRPAVEEPDAFDIEDALFVRPPADGSAVRVARGPSIGELPRNAPMPASLSGVATIKVGDKVTTDHIMPAGPRLKFRSNVGRYARYVFEGVDAGFAERAAGHRDAGLHNVIVAGESYGQGSSREHAALCPMFLGVKAVVAKSIERIHKANLVNFGVVPFVFEDASDYDRLSEGDRLEVHGVREAVPRGRAVLHVENRGIDIPLRVDASAREAAILLAGGLLNTIAGR